jgi:hypothetical protein
VATNFLKQFFYLINFQDNGNKNFKHIIAFL